MQYRELLPLLISHALSRFMEKNSEEGHSLLVPPRRRRYSLACPIGKVCLPHESRQVLQKISGIYGIKEVEAAELILQAVLNSVPIIELSGGDELRPEEVADLLSDSMVFDKTVHNTYDSKEARKRKADRRERVSEITSFIQGGKNEDL